MFEHRHPPALAYLTSSYFLFMAAFGSLVASLVLYQTNALRMSSSEAYGIFAAAMALIWILPLGGGYLSAKLGYMNGARAGILFCAAGFATLSLQTHEALYIGLALFVVGNGVTTPAVLCLVDHCYSKTSILREAGFTLFYLFFNLGAVIGIFAGGYIAEIWGFPFEFGLDALFLVSSFFILHFTQHKIEPHKGRSIAPQVKWPPGSIWISLILISLMAVPIAMLLFQNIQINNIITFLLLVLMTFILFKISSKQNSTRSKNKMVAFICLSLVSIIFWTLYSLEPSFLSVYIASNVDTLFLGMKIPASSFFAFDCIFVILIGLVLSRFWFYLSQKKKNPPLPIKFALSLLIIGVGFGFLAFMAHLTGDSLMPSSYIVFAYALFSLAELLISPLGLSMVGSLAPEGKEGVMMGFWQLCSGVGGVLSGYIATAPHFPAHGESLWISNSIYAQVFTIVGGASIIAGCFILPFVRKLKRLMVEHPYELPHI